MAIFNMLGFFYEFTMHWELVLGFVKWILSACSPYVLIEN